MYQYYVVEIKRNGNGELEHNVFWAFDENADKARLKGESKYHAILSDAAVSDKAEHAAIMFASDGTPLMHQCYKHDAVPEETPEPSVEGGEE